MKIINFPEKNGYSDKSKVFALGKFESMHLGHKKIFQEARKLANEQNLEFGIMMFDEKEQNNIYSLKERISLVMEYNPDYIMVFETNDKNFSKTKDEFNLFLEEINVKNVIMGNDFCYGKQRKGNINTFGNINTIVIDYVIFEKRKISTSWIIEFIMKSNFKNYKKLTDRFFSYTGIVEKGLGNGKKLGTPTANISFPKYKIDINDGIYFSYLTLEGVRYPSLTSVSNNPTLNALFKTYETFIFNFDRDIYDEYVKIEIIGKIRDPIKFDSLEELSIQMEQDKLEGKIFFDIEKV